MGEFLNGLAHKRRRLAIRVLDWDYPMVFGTDREFPPVYGMDWRPHRRVQLRYDATNATGASHHQKIVVIDDRIAFVGGLDFTCRRWDTTAHDAGRCPPHRRRQTLSPVPRRDDRGRRGRGAGGERRSPANAGGRRRERRSGSARPAPIRGPRSSSPTLRTSRWRWRAPARTWTRRRRCVTWRRCYLDAIARARDYIYIENQYFTSDAIGKALERRLAEASGPEIVVVTRLLSHGWLEEMTMHVLRERIVRRLRAADRHGRFHVYYPHIDGLAAGTCIDVHSKIMIADDAFLRIGSANLNNRSMGLDTECDLALEARGRQDVAQTIRRFRDRLLAEHAGVPLERASAACDRHASLAAAIAALGTASRELRPLTATHDLSDAVIDAISVTDPERPVALDELVAEFAPEPDAAEPRGSTAPRRRWVFVAGAIALLHRAHTRLALHPACDNG